MVHVPCRPLCASYRPLAGTATVPGACDCGANTESEKEKRGRGTEAMQQRPTYDFAVSRRPRPEGACYCDLDDRSCYEAGHWNMLPAGWRYHVGIHHSGSCSSEPEFPDNALDTFA